MLKVSLTALGETPHLSLFTYYCVCASREGRKSACQLRECGGRGQRRGAAALRYLSVSSKG